MSDPQRRRPRVLVAYFAPARTTSAVARAFAAELSRDATVELAEIRPLRERSFRTWLLLSYIPGLGVDIAPTTTDVSAYDLIVIGAPKWSFNCPPVTGYLQGLTGARGKPFALYVVFKEFMRKGYVSALANRIRKKGGHVVDTLALRTDEVRDGTYEAKVGEFADRLTQLPRPAVAPEHCRHRFTYYGVVNVVWKGELLGNVDVWRCRFCHILDVATRGMGRVKDEEVGFHPPAAGRQWALFVCTAQKPPSWGVQSLAPGTPLAHHCHGAAEGSESPSPEVLVQGRVFHWVWPIPEVVNRSIELG